MKSIACLLLCFLLVFSSFLVACGIESNENNSKSEVNSDSGSEPQNTSGSESSEGTSSVAERYYDADGNYYASYLPEFNEDWKDYSEFRVLVQNNVTQATYYSEEIEPLYDTTDSAIVDGVTTRNNWIYSNYGIKVKAVPVDNVKDAISKEISGGLDTFDVAMPFMPAAASLAREGSLYDFSELSDYIDLDAPWWDQNATKAMSIGNKVFFTTGDMTIMQKIVSSGIAFNKALLETYFPGFDIYKCVDDRKWTLDKLYTMCKEVTTSLVDDGVMDENDQWGILDSGPSFFYGCGEQLITKDASNLPILSLCESQRSVNVAKKVLELSVERKTWMATVDDFTNRSGVYNTIVQVFGENRSLFMALHFSAIKKLRPYSVNYGIIPAAIFDEEQEDYSTKCSAAYAFGICIPTCVKDKDYSAYMTELMSVGGKNHISDTYYNVILKNRDLDDEDSERMLDIIFDTIVYDPAVVYGFSGLNNIFGTLISAKSTDIVSTLDGMRESINDSIDDIITDYIG